MIFQFQALNVRHVHDGQLVDRRANVVGFDEVFEGRADVKEDPLVFPVVAAHQRQRLERAGLCPLDHQRGILGVEPGERRGNRLVSTLGHVGVAGLHFDAVRRCRLDAPLHEQDCRQRVPHERGTERHNQRGDNRQAGQRHAPAAKRFLFDAARGVGGRAGLQGLFDQAPNQDRRLRTGALAASFHSTDERGLQRRLVFLEVQRHLFVGDLAAKRPHQEVIDGSQHRRGEQHACADDGNGGEPRPFHGVRGEEEQRHRNAGGPCNPAQGELHAPARTYLVDDLVKVGRRG